LAENLESYTLLKRFVGVEERMETFVTRSIHDLALGAVEDQFQKVWQSLGRDYFTQDVINEKLADINNTVANNYTLLTRTDSFEAFCNGAFHKIE